MATNICYNYWQCYILPLPPPPTPPHTHSLPNLLDMWPKRNNLLLIAHPFHPLSHTHMYKLTHSYKTHTHSHHTHTYTHTYIHTHTPAVSTIEADLKWGSSPYGDSKHYGGIPSPTHIFVNLFAFCYTKNSATTKHAKLVPQ